MAETLVGGAVSQKLAVIRLTLTNFRNYMSQRLEVDCRPVLLTGPNGSGKTNMLEALSFLLPGRGLRRAKLSEVGYRSPSNPSLFSGWGVVASLLVGENELEIGTGCKNINEQKNSYKNQEKRIIKIDGTIVKSQTELGVYTSAQWLTPQMDKLFNEGAFGRRRFIDRIITGLFQDHAGHVVAYNHSVYSRNKLLKDGNFDSKWLDSVEDSIIRRGVAIAARRIEIVGRLQNFCMARNGEFPGSIISMVGKVEDWLGRDPAVVVEERLQHTLRQSRKDDAKSGMTSSGPHRSDFKVVHGDSGADAQICSTGEQKALLIGIILAAAKLYREERGYMPLLLLDEISAHLDVARRESLFKLIMQMDVQAWITGTEKDFFSSLGEDVQRVEIKEGNLIKV